MTTIVLRELTVLGRRRGLAVVGLAMVGLAAAFVVAWPSGVPGVENGNLFSQLRLVREWLATAMVPWVICRCGSRERGNDLVTLSAMSGLSPSKILAGRVLATSAVVTVLLLSALPVDVLVQQSVGAGALTLVNAESRILLVGAYAGAIALACEQLVPVYTWRWLVATIVTLAALAVIRASNTGDVLLLSITVLAAAWLATLVVRADRVWRYVDEAVA